MLKGFFETFSGVVTRAFRSVSLLSISSFMQAIAFFWSAVSEKVSLAISCFCLGESFFVNSSSLIFASFSFCKEPVPPSSISVSEVKGRLPR